MDNEVLVECLKQLERSMVKRKDADIEAFKEKQKRELTDYETKKVWESNGYSQAYHYGYIRSCLYETIRIYSTRTEN